MSDKISQQLEEKLRAAPVVPLIQANDPGVALKTAQALQDGGLDVVEVVLRTDAALDCMEAIIAETSGMIVGAGTILTADDAKAAMVRGAQFIISPGLIYAVVNFCKENGLPVFPGIMTPGEAQQAHCIGLKTVKFFPASLAGGVPMLKALGSVFHEMRFMPTGGVSAENLAEFLALPSVVACGGSWLTPKESIKAGDYAAITKLARAAVDIADASRP